MSELIQKLLDIGGCGAETEWARGYDDGVNNAINVVEEYLQQPTLNENQQIVLDWLKEYMLDDSDFYNTIYASKQLYASGVPYGKESKAFTKLNSRDLAQVLEVFSKWAQEQEE